MDTRLPDLFGRQRFDAVLGRLQNEIERVFEDFGERMPWGGKGEFRPSVDVAETKESIDITAELPGCDAKDVEVSVTGRVLTLRGEKKAESETKDKDFQMVERSFGSFVRSMTLPFEPDAGKIDARFDKGVLTVRLPKPEEAQIEAKTVPIKS